MSTISENASLTQRNTFGLPSKAHYLSQPATLDELRDVLVWARARSVQVYVLGQGSNVILAPFIDGLVIIPQAQQCQWEDTHGVLHHWDDFPSLHERVDSNTSFLLHVDAGVHWSSLVERVASKGLWGIENLALIPGNAGAAPVQNIGAYGVELSHALVAVHYVEISTGELRIISAEACQLGYRSSIFKQALKGQVIIVRVVLRLFTTPAPQLGYADLEERVTDPTDPLAIVQAVSDVRRSKLPDPAQLSNAGSFFKNPIISAEHYRQLVVKHPDLPHYSAVNGIKLAAGWLIDQCGLKGYRSGHFGIHERQALVVVHFGGGTMDELLAFSDYIVRTVETHFGVILEREPGIIG